jgi:hypothetical protein
VALPNSYSQGGRIQYSGIAKFLLTRWKDSLFLPVAIFSTNANPPPNRGTGMRGQGTKD